MIKQIPCALLCALALAQAVRADDPPALELAPLLPPKAPWLKKNQKKKAPDAQAKKVKRKKGAPPQLEVQPGAPFVAAPPSALPALPLPEPVRPPAAVAQPSGAQQQPSLSSPQPAVAQPPPTAAIAQPPTVAQPPPVAQPQKAGELSLPPLVPAAPPILVINVGVLLQNDGLDPASAARVEEGLRGVVKAAPLMRLGPVLARPASPCADDACLSAQAAVQGIDQLLVARYAAGGLRVRLLDAGSRKTLSEAAQAQVAGEPQQAAAWAEALACKLLVPAGCSGEVSADAAEGVQLELDGKPLQRGEKRTVPVGLHQLTARAGARSSRRALPVTREGAPALTARLFDGEPRLLAAGEPGPQPAARPLPREAVAETPAPAASGGWTRPAGFAALGVGAAVAVAGTYLGVKSHSDLNQAESSFRSNGGAYRPGDLATLNSGNSAARSANVLFLASGLLLAAGAVLTWAF